MAYRRPMRRNRRFGKKQRFFNRRPYGGGGRGYMYAPTDNRPRADVNVSIGRARVWIWNNGDREIVIRPGEALVIRIVGEMDTRFGHSIRGYVISEGPGPGPVESGPEERWEDWI